MSFPKDIRFNGSVTLNTLIRDINIPATLLISDSKIELSVVTNEIIESNPYSIYGVFGILGDVTLEKCFHESTENHENHNVQVYLAEEIYIGKHLMLPDDFIFDELSVDVQRLFDWVAPPFPESSEEGDLIHLTYQTTVDRILYKGNDFLVTYGIGFTKKWTRESLTDTIHRPTWLRITNLDKLPKWHLLYTLIETLKLLHFLGNIDTTVSSSIYLKKGGSEVRYMSNSNGPVYNPSSKLPVIKYEDIKDHISSIFYKWFSLNRIELSVDNVLEKSINPHLSDENYFLNACFAIETLHRSFWNYKPHDSLEIKKVIDSILQSIQNEGIKESIQNVLSHANAPSFRLRLTEFLEDFSFILGSDKNDSSSYIGKIVVSRNSLVHGLEDKREFSKEEMYHAATLLEMIIRINIYRLIELPELVIDKYRESCKRMHSELF